MNVQRGERSNGLADWSEGRCPSFPGQCGFLKNALSMSLAQGNQCDGTVEKRQTERVFTFSSL